MKAPNYLVQTGDGQLHCYWRADILLCDLAMRAGEQVKIYRFHARGFMYGYAPTTEEEIRKEVA